MSKKHPVLPRRYLARLDAAMRTGVLLLPLPSDKGHGTMIETWRDHCRARGLPYVTVSAGPRYADVALDLTVIGGTLSARQRLAVREAVEDARGYALVGGRPRVWANAAEVPGVRRPEAIALAHRLLDLCPFDREVLYPHGNGETPVPAPPPPIDPGPAEATVEEAQRTAGDAGVDAMLLGRRDAGQAFLAALERGDRKAELRELARAVAGLPSPDAPARPAKAPPPQATPGDPLSPERSIVWREDPAGLPYVREVIVEYARSRRGPLAWRGNGTRVLGYSVLDEATVSWKGFFTRRVFFLTASDPYPPGGCLPTEAVAPASIVPGSRGTPPAR